jgi:AcrR family transcriptional regulator
MSRHAKGIEDTKAALIASAWDLFSRDGYETTSIEAIILKTGVSKGAFYHHFGSKEAMLDAVAEKMTASFLESVGPMDAADGVPAIRKLDRFLGLLRVWRVAHIDLAAGMARTLYSGENVLLRSRINGKALAATQGLFAAVIRQGVAEGAFSVKDPDGTARLLLQLATSAGEDAIRLLMTDGGDSKAEEVRRLLDLTLDSWERLLAAPPGSIERPDLSILERFCRAFDGKGKAS